MTKDTDLVIGEANQDGGYLAVYPALYEPDMGAEFAQFPSKEYTDTYRTDVLFYALSKDGERVPGKPGSTILPTARSVRQFRRPRQC